MGLHGGAPPIYRPFANGVTTQFKPASVRSPHGGMPPVYRPVPPSAPLLRKPTSDLRLVAGPPVYRPGNAAGLQRTSVRTAPNDPAVPLRSAVLQPKWMFIYEGGAAEKDKFYWDDPNTPQPTSLPAVATGFKLQLVNAGSVSSSMVMNEKQYITLRGKPTQSANKMDHYNPFGRFNTNTTKTAYLTFEDGGVEIDIASISKNYDSHHAIVDFERGRSLVGLPKWVKFANDATQYNAIAADPFGITYGIGPMINPSGIPSQLSQIRHPAGLPSNAKPFWDSDDINASSVIDKNRILGMPMRKTEPDQKKVMGINAQDMATAAGYGDAIDPQLLHDPKKHGWQWLHLLSYALGGDEKRGAQDSNNLVVGTTQANTQMIIIEDAINGCVMSNLVQSAEVSVTATMANPSYRIAEIIRFVVTFKLNNGIKMPPIEFSFNALTTMTPYLATNVYVRGVLRTKIKNAEAAHQPLTDNDVETYYY
jgi:hypothetical protein